MAMHDRFVKWCAVAAFCVGILGFAAVAAAKMAIVMVNVTVAGEVDEEISGLTITTYDSDNQPISGGTTTTGALGVFTLNFDVTFGDTDETLYIYPVTGNTGYIDTISPFWQINRSDAPAKTISDAELGIVESDTATALVAFLNSNPAATNVDPTKGMLAGAVEIRRDKPEPGQSDLYNLEGATISWTDTQGQPVSADLIYLGGDPEDPEETGLPDPSLTATSAAGSYLIYNIPMTTVGQYQQQDIIVSATKSGYTIPDERIRVFPYNQDVVSIAPFEGSQNPPPESEQNRTNPAIPALLLNDE